MHLDEKRVRVEATGFLNILTRRPPPTAYPEIDVPPSTTKLWPVVQRPASEAR